MKRMFCRSRNCKRMTLVIDNISQCCGKNVMDEPQEAVRMCNPEGIRKYIPVSVKRDILERQGGRCIYCNREFGSIYERKGKLKLLKIHYDHFVPFSFSQNNYPYNFVAACQPCNLAKSNMMFDTVEKAKLRIMEKMGESWIVS